jgi:hypothetical protein
MAAYCTERKLNASLGFSSTGLKGLSRTKLSYIFYIHTHMLLGLAAPVASFFFLFGFILSSRFVPLFTRDATSMIRSKDLIEILVGKGVVRKELFVVPIVLGHVDT